MVKIRWNVDHPKYKGDIVEAVMSEDVAVTLKKRGRLTIVGRLDEPAPKPKPKESDDAMQGGRKKRESKNEGADVAQDA